MTVVPNVQHAHEPTSAPSSLRLASETAEVTTLFDPTVNVVTLRRRPSSALAEDVACVARRAGFHRLFSVLSEHAGERVAEELSDFPNLAADVGRWVEVLADLTGAENVGIRLARLETAMCPRFHVDRVLVRVVVTYLGSGTELVASEDVDRSRLGHAAAGASDEVSGLLLGEGCVRAARPFDVVFLKGEAWPDNDGRGAVHRSPAASPEDPRLVLTLDCLG